MDTLSGVVPYSVANPPVVSTVNTSGTVNGYGYNSTGTITTPGGYSTYAIPYSVSRNTFYASYWVKQDPRKLHLGVSPAPLSDELRRKLERNTGVMIAVVIRDTPAFKANILEGDVVLKVNGADVVDPPSFIAQLTQWAGKTVTLDVMRGDRPRSITVTLNP
jgi:S1-C subfamily serine protease